MEKPVTEWMLTPLRKYATFGGRAPRAEYWWFWLFSGLVIGGLTLADAMVFGADSFMGARLKLLSGLGGLALMLPNVAVQVRRLHDQDKSGWLILVGIIPVIGFLILFWFNIQRGTKGTNRFGEDPLDQNPFFT